MKVRTFADLEPQQKIFVPCAAGRFPEVVETYKCLSRPKRQRGVSRGQFQNGDQFHQVPQCRDSVVRVFDECTSVGGLLERVDVVRPRNAEVHRVNVGQLDDAFLEGVVLALFQYGSHARRRNVPGSYRVEMIADGAADRVQLLQLQLLLARADPAREGRQPGAATNTGDGRRVDGSRLVTQRMAELPRRTTQVGHHPRTRRGQIWRDVGQPVVCECRHTMLGSTRGRVFSPTPRGRCYSSRLAMRAVRPNFGQLPLRVRSRRGRAVTGTPGVSPRASICCLDLANYPILRGHEDQPVVPGRAVEEVHLVGRVIVPHRWNEQ